MAGAGFILAVLLAVQALDPAGLRHGSPPRQLPRTVGGGQVLLAVAIDEVGAVTGVETLRDTPPFTALLRTEVARWVFSPERRDGEAVASYVLVAGVFRPPVLSDAPVLGEAPQDVARPDEAIPFPTTVITPPYPPDRVGAGVVLVEIRVGSAGAVEAARVIGEPSGFDSAALQAARQWRFRSARRDGRAVEANAYLAFGFREPVTLPPPPKR